jgi:hypothetical protein
MRSALILSLLAILPLAGAARAEEPGSRLRVTAVGQAEARLPSARHAAIEAALRQAVEAAGVELASYSESRDFRLISDVIYTRSVGLVERYEVLEENPNQAGLYTVRVSAVVNKDREIDENIMAWKALLRRKGLPRVMVVGSVDRKPFDHRLTTIVQDVLDSRNITVIDLEMLSEIQRRDAERAAMLEENVEKAALITAEVGADYLVVVRVEGVKHPAERVYGEATYPVDATATVKVLRADTAEVSAAKEVRRSVSSSTPSEAVAKATAGATREAIHVALERVAEHWIEDVDRRGGQAITILAHQFSFDQLNALVQGLRRSGEVSDVIVDATDPQGRSRLRVVTNSTAADVGFDLRQIDPGVQITASSRYRLELARDRSATGAVFPAAAAVWIIGGVLALMLLVGVVLVTRGRRAA